MKEMIDTLYQQVKETNAGECHIVLEGIKKDENATAVVSVYYGQRPAHNVLDKLWNWAEEKNLGDVMDKIKELEEIESK